MKKLLRLIGMVLLVSISGTAFGEVVIREVALEWEDISNLDGKELYGKLCVSCHGVGGYGNGPAAPLLEKPVPNLTALYIRNGGEFSHSAVERMIYGQSRQPTHGSIDMPAWGLQIMEVKSAGSARLREAYARDRIHTLVDYIETIQANNR